MIKRSHRNIFIMFFSVMLINAFASTSQSEAPEIKCSSTILDTIPKAPFKNYEECKNALKVSETNPKLFQKYSYWGRLKFLTDSDCQKACLDSPNNISVTFPEGSGCKIPTINTFKSDGTTKTVAIPNNYQECKYLLDTRVQSPKPPYNEYMPYVVPFDRDPETPRSFRALEDFDCQQLCADSPMQKAKKAPLTQDCLKTNETCKEKCDVLKGDARSQCMIKCGEEFYTCKNPSF